MSSVVIANLGTGNLRSVSKAVAHVSDQAAVISADPVVIRQASHLILPGQGAIGTWVSQLTLNPRLREAVLQRLGDGPVLGICLGLQALYGFSEENGGTECLGLLEGRVRRFPSPPPLTSARDNRLKVPHMGWSPVHQTQDHPLWQGIRDGERFYFVHSYFADTADSPETAGVCEYGQRFTAAAARGNLFATQFHPEKSQQAGLRLLNNFVNWNGVR